jgi:hypothetical protein
MVIRTEYRGTRYSMGSSDPLPAGFEIRFGGLNFQATGNGYLMRLTNVRSSARGAKPGPSRPPLRTPSPRRHPPARMSRVRQRRDVVAVLAALAPSAVRAPAS